MVIKYNHKNNGPPARFRRGKGKKGMERRLHGVTALLPQGFCRADLCVDSDTGLLSRVDIHGPAAREGQALLPGLIDVHTHGGGGYDFNTAENAEDLAVIFRHYAAHGATGVLATLLADTEERLLRQLALLCSAAPRFSQLMGIHMEGPFLSAAYKGAMPEVCLRQPDIAALARYQRAAGGLIRYMTVSPELPGAAALIGEAKKLGVTVTLGHSGASYRQAMDCVAAGAACFTHTFNAMRPIEHHDPSLAAAALAAPCCCEAILDGLHLAPDTVRMLAAIKGTEQMIGITDSLSVAGLADGVYRSGGAVVRVAGGDVRQVATGTRAGSTLGAWEALKNLEAFAGLSEEAAIRCLTETPLRMLGLYDKTGSLEAGKAADYLVIEDGRLVETVCRGVTVFSAQARRER